MKTASERAMALVDGQLAPAEVPGLVQELGRNPALVAELQMYLTTSGRRICEPYGVKGDEPVPARLVEAVLQAPASAGRRTPSSRYVATLIGRLQGRTRVPAWSLVAGPALAAVLIAVAAWFVLPDRSQGSLVEASLAAALERTQSGRDAAAVAVRPVLSFKSRNATWCRQYEIRYGTRQVSHGLACRTSGGRWSVVSLTPPGPVGLMPAGSDARAAVDNLVTAMMGGQPLSNADEAAMIGKGWPQL